MQLSHLAFAVLALGSGALAAPASEPLENPALEKRTTVPGFDVSHYQGSFSMATQASKGAKFVYIKATEGTSYTDPDFSQNYNGATSAGLIRGAYHFAHPDASSGAAQATFFLKNGGGWSGDGRTLPGALDIEYNPNGATCYGLSQSAMRSWISSFGETYKASTGRYPVIYSTADWWNTCTGNPSSGFADYPWWQAAYTSTLPAPPATFPYASFWQFADSGTFPGDQDQWRGTLTNLQTFAKGG